MTVVWLIFTTPRGIRAVGARSGADRDGWVQPAEGRLGSFGRGLLAGGWVLWPVQDQRLPLRAGRETMLGKTVAAMSPIDGKGGKVFVEGEYWNALNTS